MKSGLKLGTRGSPLALAQAHETRTRLLTAHPGLVEADIEITVIKTSGDRIQDRKLIDAGGKGLFTKELEEALLAGTIDLAVHSMKDVPTLLPTGLVLTAFLPRQDPRDVLIARNATSFESLPQGAVIGTASLRRQAIVLHKRPDLRIVPLRGNVGTRLDKIAAGEADATFLALAGLRRLGLEHHATAILEPSVMLPAVAQGAIGIETRSDDTRVRNLLAPLNHAPTATCIAAERALLELLDGSCRTPIAALAELQGDAVHLRGLIVRPDGSEAIAVERHGAAADSAALGRDAGTELKSRGGADFFVAA